MGKKSGVRAAWKKKSGADKKFAGSPALAIPSTGINKSFFVADKCLYRTDLCVSPGVKSVQLVEQLQHGPLDLALAAAVAVVPLRTNSVNLVLNTNN